MPDQVLGFVGLGRMGGPMASRLVGAGFRVIGYDTDARGRESAAESGVEVVDSIAKVVMAAEAVILMLPNSTIVDAVTAEALAVPADERSLRLIIDMSSSEPERTRALAELANQRHVGLVDAPVSGGVAGAVGGELTIMVGGTAQQFADLAPIVKPLGSRIVHAGDVGAGHAVKALNNLMSAAHLLVSDEAAIIATRFGVDPAVFLSIVNTSSGRSGSTEVKLPRYVLTGAFDSGFTASLLEKDVGIATALGHSLGIDTALSDAVQERWAQLNAELPAGADHTEIIRPLERSSGTEVRSHPGSSAANNSSASSASVPVRPTEK